MAVCCLATTMLGERLWSRCSSREDDLQYEVSVLRRLEKSCPWAANAGFQKFLAVEEERVPFPHIALDYAGPTLQKVLATSGPLSHGSVRSVALQLKLQTEPLAVWLPWKGRLFSTRPWQQRSKSFTQTFWKAWPQRPITKRLRRSQIVPVSEDCFNLDIMAARLCGSWFSPSQKTNFALSQFAEVSFGQCNGVCQKKSAKPFHIFQTSQQPICFDCMERFYWYFFLLYQPRKSSFALRPTVHCYLCSAFGCERSVWRHTSVLVSTGEVKTHFGGMLPPSLPDARSQ